MYLSYTFVCLGMNMTKSVVMAALLAALTCVVLGAPPTAEQQGEKILFASTGSDI